MISMLHKPTFTSSDFEAYLQAQCSLIYGIPGSGKTQLALQLAQYAASLGMRVMIATMSTWQSFDVCRRLLVMNTHTPVYLLHKKKKTLPEELFITQGITATTQLPRQLPASISIATAQKWAWLKDSQSKFDLMIVDDANQLPYMLYLQLKGLASSSVVISDPNLIRPIITSSAMRWEDMIDAPHAATADVLSQNGEADVTRQLTCSYRLQSNDINRLGIHLPKQETLKSHAATQHRQLTISSDRCTPIIQALLDGQSIITRDLKGTDIDSAAEQIHSILSTLDNAELNIHDERMAGRLHSAKCAVICANTTDSILLERRLSPIYPELLIETADGIQGLERAITIVLHPLYSSAPPTPFTLDYGRFTTMMSRHRLASVLLQPSNIKRLLYKYPQIKSAHLKPSQNGVMDWINHVNFLT